ncbi:hypothetical protein JIN85_18065 [Luteolibacter pohnpeiensis]|uniref:Uncharacterized protein n=1 Tax=Luteolibacter pohnpeiensis TaxID=454153 RepID=A0A934VXG1_9BACT|nr:LPS assembly lipoprotein LptE [Luteolibacter pohnpeiensis]MBK1884330.1 hypothetical protein [Luteolibacter pohnpeiensis]
MKLSLLLIPALSLVSCVGYQLGGAKPPSLAKVNRISVSMFANETQHIRAETIATSAVTSAFAQDGTFRFASADQADAILEGQVTKIEYTSIRGSRLDTLLPEELRNSVTLKWQLKDAHNPIKILASGTSTGRSQLFVDSNLQTARNNALPDAMERAAESLVSQLANGF